MIKKSITVEGMTCAMCAKTIENTFENIDGVSVQVNVGAGKVLATYDEDKISLVDIADYINQAGYKAVLEASLDDNKKMRAKMKRELYISMIFSFPLLWAMLGHISFFSFVYVPVILMNGYVQLVLSGVVQFYIGKRFYVSAYKALKRKVLGMDILVVLGTTSAYFYSIYLLIQHGASGMHTEYYFEISALIITMVLLGNYFEHKAKEHTTDALVDLINLGAKEARKRIDSKDQMVPIDEVEVGDTIVVLANEKFPVDGKIIEGETYIDESMITGESIPVHKRVKDEVIGATINTREKVIIKATKVGSDTMLSQIISTVEEASSQKLPIQRTADKIASYFVPAVLAIALFTFVLHYIILDGFSFNESFVRSVAVLVISCPCALGLATPTSILVGNGKAAQNHILYKGGEFFELANKIEAIAFDKTGTLTIGKPVVTNFHGSEETLKIAFSIEKESTHPISKALVDYAEERHNDVYDIRAFETIQGKGIKARVNNKIVHIGSMKLMDAIKANTKDFISNYDRYLSEAKTTNFIAIDDKVVGLYAVRDELKPTSKAVIDAMHARGIETYMITGDHEKVANAIAKEIGVDHVYSGVLPHEKADIVKEIQATGKVTAFVGDGINDAPAIKLADVGIAMGHGTDIAIDSSDVTLMSHDLGLVIKAIEMSKKTLKNIHQNFFWAFSYNLVAIPLAASGRLSMVLAAAAMGFSSIMVVMNALRLKAVKLPEFEPTSKGGKPTMESMEIKVTNMTCNHCKMTIEKALKQAGVTAFDVDVENKVVHVQSREVPEEDIKALIREKGYEVE